MDLFALTCLVSVVLVLALGNRVLYLRTRAEAVVEHEYLPRRLHSPRLYDTPGDGRFVTPLGLAAAPVARVVAVELADDPRYAALELLEIDDAYQGRGAVVVAIGRGGSREMYQTDGLRLRPGLVDLVGPATPREGEVHHDVMLGDAGLAARFRVEDGSGMRIDVSLHEGEPPRRRAAFLRPVVGSGERPVPWFPVVFGGSVGFVSRRRGQVRVRVGGSPRRIRRYGLPVDGRRVFRAFTDLEPTCGRVTAAPQGPLKWLHAGDSGPLLVGDLELQVTLRRGHAEVAGLRMVGPGDPPLHLTFAPALPDLMGLAARARARGRFTVGVGEHRAVVAGEYRVARWGSSASLQLRPVHGWQPALGRSWVRAYGFSADLCSVAGDAVRVTAGWSRT